MTLHVLIVDDNPINLKLTSEVLSVAGFRVDVAADAEQAQAMLAVLVPDVIVMDLGLPGMDGLAFTRLLKTDGRLCRTPVIAVTAFAMKGDAEKALDAGCDAYIAKPIDTRNFAHQLLSVVRQTERGTRETLA